MTDTFIVVTGDPLDDDCEVFGPFKTERAARAVAAAGSRGEEEWIAVALEAPEQGAKDGAAVVFCGFHVVPGAYEPGVGGAIEPDFVGPFPDLAAARAWAIADGLDADAAVELVTLEPEATEAPR